MNKKIVWILIIVFLLMLCCWVILIGSAIYLFSNSDFVDELFYEINYWETQIEGLENRDDLKSFNVEPNVLVKDFEVAHDSYNRLITTFVQSDDRLNLLKEMGEINRIPTTPLEPIINYDIGHRHSFYVPDDFENVQIKANLQGKSEHVYFWVEDGLYFDESTVEFLVEIFESEIYPKNIAIFGSEWSPGIDGDEHINILYANTKKVQYVGYFQPLNEYSKKIFEDSNGMEMFIINADKISLSDENVLGLIAHEHLHLIHWFADANEDLWFDEGFAELANYLSGYGYFLSDNYYIHIPDFQLNTWSNKNDIEHYGASFLFLNYLYTHLGEDAIYDLIQAPENSLQSVEKWLKENPIFDELRGRNFEMEDIVLDWMITNLILDDDVMDGRYFYDNYELANQVDVEYEIIPIIGEEKFLTVNQFGADYLKVNAEDGFEMHFDGDDLMRLIDDPVTDGDYAMWSMNLSESTSRLMYEFNLNDVGEEVILSFDAWYEMIEEDDVVFLMISNDGGKHWKSLKSLYNQKREGDKFYYWTGNSGRWVNEKIDLSEYAGDWIWLRFEGLFLSDEDIKGMLIDDVKINAIGFSDGFENGDGKWVTDGFVRVNDLLPQGFAVAAVIDDGEEKMVEYLTLDAGNQFDFSIDAGEAESVTFVITATTLFVTDEAGYKIEFR